MSFRKHRHIRRANTFPICCETFPEKIRIFFWLEKAGNLFLPSISRTQGLEGVTRQLLVLLANQTKQLLLGVKLPHQGNVEAALG